MVCADCVTLRQSQLQNSQKSGTDHNLLSSATNTKHTVGMRRINVCCRSEQTNISKAAEMRKQLEHEYEILRYLKEFRYSSCYTNDSVGPSEQDVALGVQATGLPSSKSNEKKTLCQNSPSWNAQADVSKASSQLWGQHVDTGAGSLKAYWKCRESYAVVLVLGSSQYLTKLSC